MSELDHARFGGTCPFPGCIEPSGHVTGHEVSMLSLKDQRIAALERQLAEAQGKLEAVQTWVNGLNAPDDWATGLVGDVKADFARILKGE